MRSIVVKLSRWQNPMDLGTTHCSAPSQLRQRKMGKIPGPVCKALSITIGRCYLVSRWFLNRSLNWSSYTGVGAFVPLTILQSSHFGDQRTWRKTWGKNRLRCQPYRDLFCTSLVLRSCLPWVQVTMNHMAFFIMLLIRGAPLYQCCNFFNIVQKRAGSNPC